MSAGKVVVISGPTASGKTGISIALAKKFGGEIVNFDSLLLYKEINIGTAKPTKDEQDDIPHYMLDVRSISKPMNAAQYAALARPIVDKLLAAGKTVYLVGGSGFYLQALLKGMYDSPTSPQEILDRSEELYQREGISPFREILSRHDPGSYQRYHENDHYRIRRAVEHWWANGTPLFEARTRKEEHNAGLERDNVHGWNVLHIYLDLPKPDHLKIIEERTRAMLRNGLIEEVRELLKTFDGTQKPLQSIGYKETIEYLRGKLENLEERIIISTRQLAKSQRTWFNRDHTKKTFHPIIDRPAIFSAVEAHLL